MKRKMLSEMIKIAKLIKIHTHLSDQFFGSSGKGSPPILRKREVINSVMMMTMRLPVQDFMTTTSLSVTLLVTAAATQQL